MTGAPAQQQRAPGVGPGWARLATALAEVVPPAEIDAIWVFHPVHRDDREWGTAVVARRGDPGRVRIYTAQFIRVVRGRERGQGKTEVTEVGSGPDEVVHELLRGIEDRIGASDPPVPLAPRIWYQETDDRVAAQS